jgi:5-methylcytosine-specific restriction endonuclease McrA
MKRCSKCGEEKPRTEFHKDNRAPDRLCCHCKVCVRGAALARMRRYRATPEGRAANLAVIHRYRQTNGDVLLERRRANYAASPARVLATVAKRRALKRCALDPTANLAAIQSIHKDALLAAQFTGIEFAVDHIVPLARGGRHHANNLRHLPARLNSIKGAKLDSEVVDPAFNAWLHPTPVFEQTAYVVALRGRRRLYHVA